MSGQQDRAIYGASDDEGDDEEPVDEGKSQLASTRASQASRSRPGSGISVLDSKKGEEADHYLQMHTTSYLHTPTAVYVYLLLIVVCPTGSTKKLSKTTQPIESFKLLKNFLLLWKRLEIFKIVWAKRKLIVEIIDTPTLYKAFW